LYVLKNAKETHTREFCTVLLYCGCTVAHYYCQTGVNPIQDRAQDFLSALEEEEEEEEEDIYFTQKRQ